MIQNPNVLRCTCSHLRKQHEGGKRFIGSDYVAGCMDATCKCSKYHADAATRRVMDGPITDIMKSFLLLGMVVALVVIGANYAIDQAMGNYIVLSETTGRVVATYNGTLIWQEYNSHAADVADFDRSEDSTEPARSVILIIMGFGVFLAGTVSLMSKYEQKVKALRDADE